MQILFLSLFMLSLTTLCLSVPPSQAKKQPRPAPKTIYVGQISANGEAGCLPLLDLSETVADHPHASLFQVDWTEESGSYSELGTVFYDRLRGTLEYICKGDHNAGYGLTGEYLSRAAVREHFVFARVSPTILTKAGAVARRDLVDMPTDAFNSLQKFGCPRQALRKRDLFFDVRNGVGRVRQR